MDWLMQNKDWVFSGIGVAILSLIGGLLFKNRAGQKIKAGNNSTNIQGGKDVKVNIGGKNDE